MNTTAIEIDLDPLRKFDALASAAKDREGYLRVLNILECKSASSFFKPVDRLEMAIDVLADAAKLLKDPARDDVMERAGALIVHLASAPASIIDLSAPCCLSALVSVVTRCSEEGLAYRNAIKEITLMLDDPKITDLAQKDRAYAARHVMCAAEGKGIEKENAAGRWMDEIVTLKEGHCESLALTMVENAILYAGCRKQSDDVQKLTNFRDALNFDLYNTVLPRSNNRPAFLIISND